MLGEITIPLGVLISLPIFFFAGYVVFDSIKVVIESIREEKQDAPNHRRRLD